MELDGQVAVVTGAGRGIGKGIDQVLAEAGADVAINALTTKYVEGTAREIAAASGKSLTGNNPGEENIRGGLSTIEDARFSRNVRFEDGSMFALAAAARYDLDKGTLLLSGSEPGATVPHVVNEQITVEVLQIIGNRVRPGLTAPSGITILREELIAPTAKSVAKKDAILETVGAALFLVGAYTRIVAFILSGEMAFAYFMAHAPRSLYPVVNAGELAVLFCFIFLYFAFAGGGPLSVDRAMLNQT